MERTAYADYLAQTKQRKPKTKSAWEIAAQRLEQFISVAQLSTIRSHARSSEEKAFFRHKLLSLSAMIEKMPSSYQTDGQGMQAVAHLHYFTSSADWYITEKDAGCSTDEIEGEQHQAFGLAKIHEAEVGYIPISELIKHGAELDLYFEPVTLAELLKEG